MYQIQNDRVIEIHSIPWPDIGAPLPTVVASERWLYLAYIISEPELGWDGSDANVLSRHSPDLSIAIVGFEDPLSHLFGPPNDETYDDPRKLDHRLR